MAKLSPSLRALIDTSFARPGPGPVSAAIQDVYQSIARDAASRNLGPRPWLAISAATIFTLNASNSLPILYDIASADQRQLSRTQAAEFIREVGLKCISFNGIPRTINCLNAFRAFLPSSVASTLETRPSRLPTPENLDQVSIRGRQLWDSVYAPFENRLLEKLAAAHPDLPVHILTCHYGPLLSDPAGERGALANTGRVLTSIVAIACLRAQTGVGPQLLSHVFGLRKAFEDGTYRADDPPESEETVSWLAGDEGLGWILRSVDKITQALGGSNFAQTPRGSKL